MAMAAACRALHCAPPDARISQTAPMTSAVAVTTTPVQVSGIEVATTSRTNVVAITVRTHGVWAAGLGRRGRRPKITAVTTQRQAAASDPTICQIDALWDSGSSAISVAATM